MMTMEARVTEMETEVRALRRAVAALAPAVATSVLTELRARGALLVVRAEEEMNEVVEKCAAKAVEEMVVEKPVQEKIMVAKRVQEEAVVVEKTEEAMEKVPVVVECELEEQVQDDDEDVGELEVLVAEDEDPRVEVGTSQESNASGSSRSSDMTANSSSDAVVAVEEAPMVPVPAFEDTMGHSVVTPPPSSAARIRSRPPVIVQTKKKSLTPKLKKQRMSPKKAKPLALDDSAPSSSPVTVPMTVLNPALVPLLVPTPKNSPMAMSVPNKSPSTVSPTELKPALYPVPVPMVKKAPAPVRAHMEKNAPGSVSVRTVKSTPAPMPVSMVKKSLSTPLPVTKKVPTPIAPTEHAFSAALSPRVSPVSAQIRVVTKPTVASSNEDVILPADFEIPTKDSVAVAWVKWCCGDPVRGLPPFRSVTTKQISIKGVSRRLSDLRCAMLPIETMAQTTGMWKPNFTPQDAAAVFAALEQHLPQYTSVGADGRKRKKEVTWSTVLNHIRKKRKQESESTIDQTLI